MSQGKNRYSSISLLPETKEKLETFGRKGDRWDDILNKLMRIAEKAKKMGVNCDEER